LAVLSLAGCGGPEPRPRTVEELSEDPIVLQGLVARCAADARAAALDKECANARVATERLASAEEAKHTGDHTREFEQQRELRRAREDAARRDADQKQPSFDPYSSPVTAEPAEPPPKP
jgi:hypothetical protein